MQSNPQEVAAHASVQAETRKQGRLLRVSVCGRWCMGDSLPAEAHFVLQRFTDARVRELSLDADDLNQWDTSLLVFLVRVIRTARKRGLTVNLNLPEGLTRLLSLALSAPAGADVIRRQTDETFLSALGGRVFALLPDLADFFYFLGEIVASFQRLVRGQSHMRLQDLMEVVHECGVRALPIVSLTSLLFGLILAFVGWVQLTQFGAQVYVAGLVGIGMLRIMGAMMVGVVMSGRIGAAYAALTGAMQVNEEVDALSAAGIYPVDFLVLPRVLALTAMTPLLTLYADIMGIAGGYLVGVTMMGLNPYEYLNATVQMTPFRHVLVGLVYGAFFGVIIALSGCFHGMRCGRSAGAVGLAVTTAVVHALVGIIVATAVITVVCTVLGV
ncbi:ABC transporter permease [Deltaproteobacteria bacterium]|nr:ABC transporter permease [Deltaproteobacteria bacterium]